LAYSLNRMLIFSGHSPTAVDALTGGNGFRCMIGCAVFKLAGLLSGRLTNFEADMLAPTVRSWTRNLLQPERAFLTYYCSFSWMGAIRSATSACRSSSNIKFSNHPETALLPVSQVQCQSRQGQRFYRKQPFTSVLHGNEGFSGNRIGRHKGPDVSLFRLSVEGASQCILPPVKFIFLFVLVLKITVRSVHSSNNPFIIGTIRGKSPLSSLRFLLLNYFSHPRSFLFSRRVTFYEKPLFSMFFNFFAPQNFYSSGE
jgi:hypothetical protein